jgi:hypothetical protein
VRRKQNREKIPGIKGVSGSVFEASEPPSVVSVAYLTEEQARIYLERQDMTLTEDIGVNINSPGRYSSFAHVIRATVPKGRRVNSYFIQSAKEQRLGFTVHRVGHLRTRGSGRDNFRSRA